MSSRQLDALPDRDGYIVRVGWDRPLRSFFAQVINTGVLDEESPDAMPVWLGAAERVTDPETVIEAVRPYAAIPGTLRADLEADRAWEGTRARPGFAHTVPVTPGPAPLETTATLTYLTSGGSLVTCPLRVYRTGIFSVTVVVTDTASRAPSRTRRIIRALRHRTAPGRTPDTDHAATIHALLRAAFSGQHVEHIEYTPHQSGEVFHAFRIAHDGSTTREAIPLEDMLRRFGADITP
ncbi:hypothetical protein ACIBSS_29080 [Micromonospora aurantiaca]|uniref:hypothetical protein n=1 Tax=Micromonospora aurantiaca (nom. illeg.) TaxID=47850 RepID=UPI000F3BFA5F|nr:hypothetical protein [Micromonospora aurantiaca]RNH90165.1 hypothetical protein EEZ25_34015 [Micromonospora aurantiaca]